VIFIQYFSVFVKFKAESIGKLMITCNLNRSKMNNNTKGDNNFLIFLTTFESSIELKTKPTQIQPSQACSNLENALKWGAFSLFIAKFFCYIKYKQWTKRVGSPLNYCIAISGSTWYLRSFRLRFCLFSIKENILVK